MEITEIRIKLMERSEDRLRAFCSITIDHSFVVRDLKIIDGSNGPFVAMPSRKLTGHCQRCNHKNHLRASYCNHCGAKQKADGEGSYDSPQKLYADVAHPINSSCRELIQNAVIEEFQSELDRAAQPGYRSRYDDDFGDVDVITTPKKNSNDDEATELSSEPSRSVEKSGPPRPHFLNGPADSKRRSRSVSNSSDRVEEDDDDGSFGAGVF